ncbi:MAG: hypothetical protein AAF587_26450 [Bacteroidota bacterium]
MLVSNFRPQLIDSIAMLAERFCLEEIPESTVKEALSANPWFTEFYLDRSLRAIQTWLDRDLIQAFVDRYPAPPDTPLQIGIIAAGNVPLVGFHDVLICLLSGNIAYVKCSHQDRVLMEWIRDIWLEELPLLKDFFHIVPKLAFIDHLIATGNNNSARYFHRTFREIPRIVRKNRFSVAILTPEVKEESLELLCQDILLYNGLGCRNVSNLILAQGFDLKRLIKHLNAYTQNFINPLYLERVLYEKTRMKVLGLPAISSKNLLFLPSTSLEYTAMGTIRVVTVQSEEEISDSLKTASSRIQCIIGRDTPFGQSQEPQLDTFADGIDTMAILTNHNPEEK